MRKTLCSLALGAFLGSDFYGLAQSNLVTLFVPGTTSFNITESTIQFSSNQVVTVVGSLTTYPIAVDVNFANGTIANSYGNSISSGSPKDYLTVGHRFTGLSKITIKNSSPAAQAYFFSVTTPGSEPASIPSGTVVIPTDATGPVRIILESSTDLVTWTEANPGTYAKDNPNRFFRVRAVNQ